MGVCEVKANPIGYESIALIVKKSMLCRNIFLRKCIGLGIFLYMIVLFLGFIY